MRELNYIDGEWVPEKSSNMTTTKNWRDDFDKKAELFVGEGGLHVGCYECEEGMDKEEVKFFIEQLLEEIEGEIGNEKVIYKTTDKEYNQVGGPNISEQFNQGLDTALEVLTRYKNK